MKLGIIVAADEHWAIGKNGELPWRLPDDFKRFKALTMGHPMIMGRRTWQSLGGKPLPGRRHIIVTSKPGEKPEGTDTAPSLAEAIQLAQDSSAELAWVIGGAGLIGEAAKIADVLELTRVHAEVEADTFLPRDIPWTDYWLEKLEHHPRDANHAHGFSYETWVRK